MIEIPKEIELALQADDAEPLNELIEEGNPEDFQVLQALARDEDTPPELRRKALYAIGRWQGRNEAAVEAIREALPSLNELERIAALDALGRIGTLAAYEAVMLVQEDVTPDVRRYMVKALHDIGTEPALDALERLAVSDDVEMVRELARQKLQQRGRAAGGPEQKGEQ
ncbi:MAG: HEAT repeat domain-containing protein [Candidatus Promineifilaceae bacterium]|nr:HEAT repeat domain-containing protein [Candidatus Promineifilaceae bacterium]